MTYQQTSIKDKTGTLRSSCSNKTALFKATENHHSIFSQEINHHVIESKKNSPQPLGSLKWSEIVLMIADLY